MKAVLDACVLFPTVLREILLGVAAKGLYEPLWSDRILREWVLATVKLGPLAPLQAEGWYSVKAMIRRSEANRVMDDLSRAGCKGILLMSIESARI